MMRMMQQVVELFAEVACRLVPGPVLEHIPNTCHMLYFHQVQFWLHSYLMLLCISNLFSTQLRTSFISFIIVQVAFILSLIFLFVLCSSHHPHSIYPFDHLLFCSLIISCTLHTFSSFLVFACEYRLHVILSVPCYILPFPSLTIACDISYILFYSYLHRYDYSIYVQLHIQVKEPLPTAGDHNLPRRVGAFGQRWTLASLMINSI